MEFALTSPFYGAEVSKLLIASKLSSRVKFERRREIVVKHFTARPLRQIGSKQISFEQTIFWVRKGGKAL
jgi:hypothetical protein